MASAAPPAAWLLAGCVPQCSRTHAHTLLLSGEWALRSAGTFIKRTAAADLLLPAKLNILLILLEI
jgi:hypothetical protein